MSTRTTPSAATARSGLPPRAATVHTLPTARRPGPPSRKSVIAVVPLDAVDDRAQAAMTTALSMSASRVIAVHVCDTLESTRAFTRAWEHWEPGVPLVLLDRIPSPSDPVAGSIADYLGRRHTAYQVFVVVAGTERHAFDDALLPLPNVVVCHRRDVPAS